MTEQKKILSIQMYQQLIRSKIENFQWETNPQWQSEFYDIMNLIKLYWKDYLQRDTNNKPTQ